ncbi:MAG: hypothetical protein AAF711_18020, partial [Planctomycetota bacterium]
GVRLGPSRLWVVLPELDGPSEHFLCHHHHHAGGVGFDREQLDLNSTHTVQRLSENDRTKATMRRSSPKKRDMYEDEVGARRLNWARASRVCKSAMSVAARAS